MVMRYGSRIWKLRVMQAEIKMTIRSSVLAFRTVAYTLAFFDRLLLSCLERTAAPFHVCTIPVSGGALNFTHSLIPASFVVSGGALNFTHSLIPASFLQSPKDSPFRPFFSRLSVVPVKWLYVHYWAPQSVFLMFLISFLYLSKYYFHHSLPIAHTLYHEYAENQFYSYSQLRVAIHEHFE